MRHCFLPVFLFFAFHSFSQTTVGLAAYYTFDGKFEDVTGNTANTAIAAGQPEFGCGLMGQAVLLDGGNDRITIPGADNINREFDTEDFTVSFYFKAIGTSGTPYLFSKRSADCLGEHEFFVRYSPLSLTLETVMFENPSRNVRLIERLFNSSCWQLVTVVREASRVKLYVNGKFARDLGTAGRIDIENDGEIIIGASNCAMGNEPPFKGLIDELRIYSRALNEEEVAGLYFAPDMILNRDTVIFLGTQVDINMSVTCGTGFDWQPASGVAAPSDAEPAISPLGAGEFVYKVRISDQVSTCVAGDSIRITVIDPAELDCNVLFLPKAFTPNDDGLNDTYGISNPFAVESLISFEIFDRWGGRIFYTENAFDQWDGTFQGKPLNPGVFLYRVRYKCEEAEKLATGSLTILR